MTSRGETQSEHVIVLLRDTFLFYVIL